MSFPSFLDTCVLFPAYLADTLLWLAEEETYRPLWSVGVLDELEGVLAREAGLAPAAVDHRLAQMRQAFPDAEVAGYENLVSGMTNHPKDRHVLAAAVRGNAEVIVTFNLWDFPAEALDPYDISARHPDEFLLDQLDLYPGVTMACLRQQVARYKRGPSRVAELLGPLTAAGVPEFAAEVRRHLPRDER